MTKDFRPHPGATAAEVVHVVEYVENRWSTQVEESMGSIPTVDIASAVSYAFIDHGRREAWDFLNLEITVLKNEASKYAVSTSQWRTLMDQAIVLRVVRDKWEEYSHKTYEDERQVVLERDYRD